MMLPSGNDAAYQLAQFFGEIVRDKIKPDSRKLNHQSKFGGTRDVKYFLWYMNEIAHKELGMS